MEDTEKKWMEQVFALKDKYLVNRWEEFTPAGKVRAFRKEFSTLFKKKPEGLFWDKVVNLHFEKWLESADDDEVYSD